MEGFEREVDLCNYGKVESVRDSFDYLGAGAAAAAASPVVFSRGVDDAALKTKAIDHDNNNTTVELMEMDDEMTITTNVEATLDATQCVQDTLRELFVVTGANSTGNSPEHQTENVEKRLEEAVIETEKPEQLEAREEENTTAEATEEEEEEKDEQIEANGEMEEEGEGDVGVEGLDASFNLSQEDIGEWNVVDEVNESIEEESKEFPQQEIDGVSEEEVSAAKEKDYEEHVEAAKEEDDLAAVEDEATSEVQKLPQEEDKQTQVLSVEDELENETDEITERENEQVTPEDVYVEEEEGEDYVAVDDDAISETMERQEVEELIIEEDEEDTLATVEEDGECPSGETYDLTHDVEEVTIEEVEHQFDEEDEEMEQEVDIEGDVISPITHEIEKDFQNAEEINGASRVVDEAMRRSSDNNDTVHPREESDSVLSVASNLASTQNETISIKNLYAEQSPPHRSQIVIDQSDENSAIGSFDKTSDEINLPFMAAAIKQEVLEHGVGQFSHTNAMGMRTTAAAVAATTLDASRKLPIVAKKRKKKKTDQTGHENGVTQPATVALGRPPITIGRSYPLCESHALPFERGWKREIVHRSVVMTGSKAWKSVDVYYFTPAGRKMRSLREVGEYLEKINDATLTLANFSFSRKIISNSPLETSRTAKRRGAPTLEDGSKPAKVPCPKTHVFPSKPRSETKISAQFGVPKVIALPKGTNIVEKRRTEGELTTDVKRCSFHCPGQQGIIPTLQCTKCLCLFHPRCVGLADSFTGLLTFICRECGGSYTPLKNTSSLVRLLSPTVTKNSSANNNVAGNNSVNIRPHMLTYPNNPGNSNRVSCKNVTVSPVWSINPPLQTTNLHNTTQFPCGVTIEKIPPGTKPVPSELPTASISVIPMNRPLMFSRLQTPQTSVKSIVRPEFAPRGYHPNYLFPNLTNAMMRAISTQNNNKITPEQQSMHTNYRVVRALKPSFPAGNLQTYSKITERTVTVNASGNQLSLPMSASEHAYTKIKPNNGHPQVSIVRQNKLRSLSAPNPINCFVSSLNGGFTSLLKIFKYLSLPDLLQASQVCCTWRDVARHCLVWETVVLKNVRIRNWEMFGRSAPTLTIQQLDMRGMPISDNKDVTFRGILLLSSKIKNLQTLHLCEVPAYIVHTVTTQHPNLKCFTSEWITEENKENSKKKCNLDLVKFGKVVNLETLQLRGIYGLYLLGNGLRELETLNRLTRLCITSLRGVPPSQYSFLKCLPKLKTLELGECLEFTEEVYETIGQLTNLTTLRLEFGGNCAERGVEIVLSSLQNLVRLELIIFRIPPNFGELLEKVKNLRHMTIWPDMKFRPDHNNYNTVRATKFIPFVKTLMWGLVTLSLHDSNHQIGSAGDSQHRIDHNSCCIPFLSFNLGCTIPLRTYISAHQLMNKLRSELPQSKVQVVMVPNSSYRTIAYMPR